MFGRVGAYARTGTMPAIVVAILFVVTCVMAGCGHAAPTTLEEVFAQASDGQQALQDLEDEFATNVNSLTGIQTSTQASVKENELQIMAFLHPNSDQQLNEIVTTMFTGQVNTWQALAAEVISMALDGRSIMNSIAKFEDTYNLSDVIYTYSIYDANGNLLSYVIYNRYGKVQQ